MSRLLEFLRRANLVPGRLGRYVLMEYLGGLLMATGVLTGFLVLMTSMQFEGQAKVFGTSVATLVYALPYLTPYLMLFVVPMAFLIAGVLAFGRLEGSGEISAMRAAGVRLTTVIGPPLVVALLAAAPMVVLADSGMEWGFDEIRQMILASSREALTHRADAGKTLSIPSGNRSYRIHRFRRGGDGTSAVAIVEFADGAPSELILARDHRLEITRSEPGPDGPGFDVFRFSFGGAATASDGKGWVRVFKPGEFLLAADGRLDMAFADASRGRDAFGSREYASGLGGNVRVERELEQALPQLEREQAEAAAALATARLAGGTPSPAFGRRLDAARERCEKARAQMHESAAKLRRYRMEVHRKLSMAFSPVAMALLGIALGLRLGRGTRLVGFTVGIAVIAVAYYPVWLSGQGLAVSGVLPAGLAVWFAPALVAAIGAAWLSRMT